MLGQTLIGSLKGRKAMYRVILYTLAHPSQTDNSVATTRRLNSELSTVLHGFDWNWNYGALGRMRRSNRQHTMACLQRLTGILEISSTFNIQSMYKLSPGKVFRLSIYRFGNPTDN